MFSRLSRTLTNDEQTDGRTVRPTDGQTVYHMTTAYTTLA